MSLIKCPECGKEISDKSKVCIHCGFPLQEEPAKPKPVEILQRSPLSVGRPIAAFIFIDMMMGLFTFAISFAFVTYYHAEFVIVAILVNILVFIINLSIMIYKIVNAVKTNNRLNINAIEYDIDMEEFVCHGVDDTTMKIPYQESFKIIGNNQAKVVRNDGAEIPLGYCTIADVIEADKRIKEVTKFGTHNGDTEKENKYK